MQEWDSCGKLLQLGIKRRHGPSTYVDPKKTIIAACSQGNELVFGQNAGQ